MGVSLANHSVKIWWNLPISNPNPELQNSTISMHKSSLEKSIDVYSSYHLETKIWACLGQITPSKFDEICPLAIPNQISTISMHISNLMKIIDVYSSYHPETKNRWTDDGWTDRHTEVQPETIIPRHYIVAGYKNGKKKKKKKKKHTISIRFG